MSFLLKRFILFVTLGLGVCLTALAAPTVEMQTSHGRIVIELNAEKAPKTVENFVKYVNQGFYNDTIFHRVIDGFMIQGGGMTKDMKEKPTSGKIRNEANNGLKNKRGTIVMARTPDPHSASSQFFINLVDNTFLDFTSEQSPQTWGYAVFGQVIEGMDVVDRIAKVKTGNSGGHQNVPVEPVVIKSVTIITGK